MYIYFRLIGKTMLFYFRGKQEYEFTIVLYAEILISIINLM